MKRFFKLIIILFLLYSDFSIAQGISSEDSAKIEKVFYYYKGKVPGAMLSILDDGTEIYTKFFGLANYETKEELSRENLFYLSSVSKVYTVMAILKLSELGKLSLEESLQDIYPSLPSIFNDVKIDNLLSHTSGLPMYKSEDIHNFEQLFNFIRNQDSLLINPGDKWLYSNTDYKLLANIVEIKSKKTYQDFLKKEVFKKMKISKNQFIGQIDDNLIPKGYREKSWKFTLTKVPDDNIVGEKGAYVNLNDLIRITNAVFYDINSPVDNYKQPLEHFINNAGNKINYGYSWYIVPQDKDNLDKTIYWLGGKDSGYQNVIVHFPEENITLLLFMNRGNSYFNLVKMAVDLGKMAIE